MTKTLSNPEFVRRFDELIAVGQDTWWDRENGQPYKVSDPLRFTQRSPSCLKLLYKLSVSTNRFGRKFERYSAVQASKLNVGLPPGVLKPANGRYAHGLAVDYHFAVSTTLFGSLRRREL